MLCDYIPKIKCSYLIAVLGHEKMNKTKLFYYIINCCLICKRNRCFSLMKYMYFRENA